MDHQGSPPAASASINGVWGAPSGNYALRPTPYSLSSSKVSPSFFVIAPRGSLTLGYWLLCEFHKVESPSLKRDSVSGSSRFITGRDNFLAFNA